ncbi:glycosyltransferase family 4 protein [Bradyrhizobium sp. SRL28]|uniref:glycosyltransferase family 4 protein n=1 Tax=Bradyrhizobium sp. SRL28 TaxID=2836178 RepID=UPI001BDE119E|nr:glycosyltransferase family 4 protein [Bradyrhizobium sp. SRL28]MBT1515633.1 glycosyltransferase family 4 protein [Bradyrhizobium sp. SRL28]
MSGREGEGARRLRVLVLAEAANPEWTSVPLIGWSLTNALSKVADVHLVTQIRNKPALLRKGWTEGADFTAIDNEGVVVPLHSIAARLRGGGNQAWTTVMAFTAFAYYSFELQVWKLFRDRLMANEFDVVHRITPLSPTIPSLMPTKLAKLNVPFVLGPLNGGVPWPKGFRHRQYAEKELLSHIRPLYRLMPAYRSTRKNSAAIISGSTFTQSEMPDWVRQKSVFIPENGVDIDLFNNPRRANASLPLQAAFVGRLVPYKGADILIEAARSYLKAGSLTLHIIGDGPQKQLLLQQVEALGLQERVIFHGWVPHSDIQAKLRDCDFLGLPSIREFGGGVVVEAMALGVTPIVADYGGPADLVDDKTGIRVPFGDEKSLVEGFRSAIASVTQAPELLNDLGGAARKKVLQSLTWDAKARQMLRIYEAARAGAHDLRALGLEGGAQ